LLQIVQRSEQRALFFRNALQGAAIEVACGKLLLLSIHHDFQIVQDNCHLIQYF